MHVTHTFGNLTELSMNTTLRFVPPKVSNRRALAYTAHAPLFL